MDSLISGSIQEINISPTRLALQLVLVFVVTRLIVWHYEQYGQSNSFSKENYFEEAIKLYEKEKYEDARFLFERNIVFNPKDANSYLYLAKIYNHEEDQRKEEYNLETTLLIDPQNEEAILMMMKIALEKSNYDKVKELSETFVQVCKTLCDENNEILESLKNLEPSNES